MLIAPKSGDGAEGRRASRIQVEAQVSIWPIIDGSPGAVLTALARDLSLTGIGLFQTLPMKPKDQFVLRLPRRKAEPLLLLCEVAFVKTVADGLYGVGASFSSILEQQKEPGAGPEKASRNTMDGARGR
jgi:hypothetical protein